MARGTTGSCVRPRVLLHRRQLDLCQPARFRRHAGAARGVLHLLIEPDSRCLCCCSRVSSSAGKGPRFATRCTDDSCAVDLIRMVTRLVDDGVSLAEPRLCASGRRFVSGIRADARRIRRFVDDDCGCRTSRLRVKRHRWSPVVSHHARSRACDNRCKQFCTVSSRLDRAVRVAGFREFGSGQYYPRH